MSINKFQEKVFRTGCGSAVLYVCAAVFFGGMFYMGCGLGGGGNGRPDNDNRAIAFQVGDTPVYAEDFNLNVQQQREQTMMQSGHTGADALSPIDEAQIEAQVINEYVTRFGNIALAKKAGVKFTDEQMTQLLKRDYLDAGITSDRTRLVTSKKLKADANAAEFDAALKKEKLRTVAERTKEFNDDIKKALSDEKTRLSLEDQVARPLLIEAIKATMKPSVEQLRASYDTYEFKRILFAAHAGSTVDSQIAKAQADLKAGVPFEQVIDRYSSEPPLKGKKLSDNTIDLTPSQFDMFPEYKALKPLKQGQVSDVIETPQGKSIYKMIGVKNSAPADLATNSKKYIDAYVTPKANTEYQDEIKRYTLSGAVTWKIAGLKALYDWYQVRTDFTTPPAQQVTKMAEIIDEAKKAMNAGGDTRSAALAWFAAFDSIWNGQGADKVKLRGDRIEVLKAITSVQPFFSLKMELVDLLADSNAGPEAVSVLKSAASSNVNYELQGQQNFQDVQVRMMSLESKKMMTKDDEEQLTQIQDEWKKENDVAQKEKAEMKKEQDKAKAEQDALIAKQKADKEKALKGKSTPPAPPAGQAPATPPPSAPAGPGSAPGSAPAPGKK